MTNDLTGHRSALPHVPQEVVGELLEGDVGSPDFIRAEWAEISETNPHLRDLVSLVAAAEEPEDLEARQRVIDAIMIVLGAVGRSSELAVLERLFQDSGLDEIDRVRVLSGLRVLAESRAGQASEAAYPEFRRSGFGYFSKLSTACRGVLRSIRPRPLSRSTGI